MRQDKVAVLMTTFNGEEFIEEQIETIVDQKGVSLEVFISDDGSSDNTLTVIHALQKKFKNLYLLKPQPSNLGPGKNFYRLIKSLPKDSYDFVALSDQDDIWPQNKLSRALDVFKNSNIDGYSSDAITFRGNLKSKAYLKKSYPQKKYDYLFEGPGPGCTFVLKKNLFSKLQEFLKRTQTNFLYHDWLIYAFARAKNFSWHIDDRPNIFYRQHNSNYFGAHKGFLSSMNRIYLILNRSWGGRVNQLFYLLDVKEFKEMSPKNRKIYFLRHIFQTRRRYIHALMNFILIALMKENE